MLVINKQRLLLSVTTILIFIIIGYFDILVFYVIILY